MGKKRGECDMQPGPERMMNHWLWLCPLLGVALAAGVLVMFGWQWWSALLAALLLVCPALVVWGWFTLRPGP